MSNSYSIFLNTLFIENLFWKKIIILGLISIISIYYNYFKIYYKKLFISKSVNFSSF